MAIAPQVTKPAIRPKATRKQSGDDPPEDKDNWDDEELDWTYNQCLLLPKERPIKVQRFSHESVVREDICVVWGGERLRSEEPVLPEQTYPPETRDNVFTLHNILSPTECRWLISTAEPLLEPVDHLFEQRYRKSERVLLKSPKIAQQLYNRILPHLRASDYKNRIPLCFGQSGSWVPFGLNECLKVTKYTPGGLFAYHRDGPWIPREDQASIYTVIIYLNEEFRGGMTELGRTHVDKSESPKKMRIKERIIDFTLCCGAAGQETRQSMYASTLVPTTGTALLFNHDLWHAGLPVENGCKYILRTELIFQRVHNLYVDRYAFTSDEKYFECRELYNRSQRAMMEGRRREFVEMYQEVVARQLEALRSSQRILSRSKAILSSVNDDVMSCVFYYLGDPDLLRVSLCSTASYYRVVQSDVWRLKAEARFPSCIQFSDASQILKSQRAVVSKLPLDWYTVYAQRVKLTREFMPAAVWLRTEGSVIICNEGGTAVPYRHDVQFGLDEDTLETAFELEGVRFRVRESEWRSEYVEDSVIPEHLNFPDDQRFCFHSPIVTGLWETFGPGNIDLSSVLPDEGEEPPLTDSHHGTLICQPSGEVRWDVMSSLLIAMYDPVWTPTLIVGHPLWYNQVNDEMDPMRRKQLYDTLFTVTRTPAIYVVNPALPATMVLMSKSGERRVTAEELAMYPTHHSKLVAILTIEYPLSPKALVSVVNKGTFKVVRNKIVDLNDQQATSAALLEVLLPSDVSTSGVVDSTRCMPMHLNMTCRPHSKLCPEPFAAVKSRIPAPFQLVTDSISIADMITATATLITNLEFRDLAEFRPLFMSDEVF